MPDRKIASLVGIEGSILPPLAAALDAIGYDTGETNAAVVLVLVQDASDEEALLAIAAAECPVVAIIDPENANLLNAVTIAGARGILDLPIRRSAVAIQIGLAIAAAAYHKRVENKAALLERTLKSRRIIEKATQVVATLRGITQADAYEYLRRASMSRRVTMAEAAQDFLVDVEAIAGNETSMSRNG